MKTCSNPKCKATNIPDDAMFCPKCGEALVETSNPWKEKYDALQQERSELKNAKQRLERFESERQTLYSTLGQYPEFDIAMKESANIIQNNRSKEIKANRNGNIIGYINLALFILAIVLGIYFWLKILIQDNPVSKTMLEWGIANEGFLSDIVCLLLGIGWLLLALAPFMLFVFFIAGITSRLSDFKPKDYKNEFITMYLIPFVEANENNYKVVNKNILDEICSPLTISCAINEHITELNNRINDINQKINLTTSLTKKIK